MKNVKLLANVHLSPNFGLGKLKYKEGDNVDAKKGTIHEVNDDVAAALVKQGLAEITNDKPAAPEAKEAKEAKGNK